LRVLCRGRIWWCWHRCTSGDHGDEQPAHV
jgi:hypothetical protein